MQWGAVACLSLGWLTAADRRPLLPDTTNRFRVESRLVLIPVSVTDRSARPVMGLDRQNFRIYEAGVEQQLIQCSREDLPLAIGLVFDTSRSMTAKMGAARAAAAALLGTANPEDELFLIEFQDTARVTQPATPDAYAIRARLAQASPQGHTALFDAVRLGVEELHKSTKPRKALVILSDGNDNRSRYTAREVRSLLRESDIAVYAMGLFSSAPLIFSEEDGGGPGLLEDLTRETGGRLFPVTDLRLLPDAAADIGAELHNLYVLGYQPSDNGADGKYHSVQVKVDAPRGVRAVQVSWRPGYLAPNP